MYLNPANLVLLLLPAITLLLTVRFLTFVYGGSDSYLSVRMMRFVAYLMLAASVGGILWSMQRLLIPASPIFLAIILAILSVNRRTKQQALIAGLALAHKYQVPLPIVINAIAEDQQGSLKKRLHYLSESISKGESLNDALLSARLNPSCATRLALTEFYNSSTAPEALRTAIADDDRVHKAHKNAVDHLLYIFVVIVVCTALNLFLVLRTIPMLQNISYEFGTLETANIATLNPYTWMSLSTLSACLICFSVFLIFFAAPVILSVYLGWFPKNWTLATKWNEAYYRSQMLRAIRQSLIAQNPIAQSLARFSKLHPIKKYQRRLGDASQICGRGKPWHEAIFLSRLITPADRNMLASQQSAQGYEKALDYLAEQAIRSQLWKSQRFTQIIGPVAVTLLALSALLPAYYVMKFLTETINGLANAL